MRPTGTKQQLEVRRRTAVALRKQGMGVREVARRVGSVPSSVVRWEQAFDRRGERGLDSKPQAGGKSRLTKAQKARLRRYLLAGPRAAGWHNELWTLSRVAKLIADNFEVRYHISNVHRLLRELRFSPQKPARLARERNDDAVAEFQEKRWPAIKKSPPRGADHRPRR
jgi:transposase